MPKTQYIYLCLFSLFITINVYRCFLYPWKTDRRKYRNTATKRISVEWHVFRFKNTKKTKIYLKTTLGQIFHAVCLLHFRHPAETTFGHLAVMHTYRYIIHMGIRLAILLSAVGEILEWDFSMEIGCFVQTLSFVWMAMIQCEKCDTKSDWSKGYSMPQLNEKVDFLPFCCIFENSMLIHNWEIFCMLLYFSTHGSHRSFRDSSFFMCMPFINIHIHSYL